MKMEQMSQDPKKNILCVGNIDSTTSAETFSLYLEYIAGGDAEIDSVVYTEDRSTAVVEFNTPVDLTEIQRNCKLRSLEDKCLEVCAIDPVKYIVVSAEEDITIEELKEYFQNRVQSDGGIVQKVSLRQDGCFTVKFKHEKDALRAGKESSHVVSNISVTVTPLFFAEYGDACNGIYDVTKHFVSLPSSLVMEDIDVYIKTFLQQSKSVVDHLNYQLKGKYAKVTFKDITQIECLLNKRTPNVCELVKTWETEAKATFRKYIHEMLHKIEIQLTEDAWNEVECITTKQNHSSDNLITFHEKNSLRIVFVGKKEILEAEHQKIADKIQRMRHVIKEETFYCIHDIMLLKRSGTFEEIESISEDLKVDQDYQTGKIHFSGIKEDVLKARLKIGEKILEFESWTISEGLSKHQLELLADETIKSMLDKLFEKDGLTVEMGFQDDSIKVYAINNCQRNLVNGIIMNMVKESKIPLDETSKSVISINNWAVEIDALYSETKNKVKISIESDTEILITATSDLHDNVKQRLQTFVEKYSIYQDLLHIDDEGIYNFLLKHCIVHLKETLEKYEEYFFTLDLHKNPMVLSGRKEGLSLARADMDTMIKRIQYEQRTYKQPGITKILTKDQLPLFEIEKSCRSVVMFTGPLDSTSCRNTIVPRQNGRLPEVAVWVYGDTQKDIQDTFQEISIFIESNVLKQDILIGQKLLPNITPKELEQFYHIAEDCELSIDQQRMTVTVKGVIEEIDKTKDKIFELCKKFQEDIFHNEIGKQLAETVQWKLVKDDQETFSSKKEFTLRENMDLEKAYRKEEQKIILENMVVDFTSMKIYPMNEPQKTANVIRQERIRGSNFEFPINWVHMEFPETLRIVTLDKTSAEYVDLQRKFLDSVKNGIYNTGKTPNRANNPIGQFKKVKVHKINRIQNTALYMQYAVKRASIARHSDGKTLEMDLWHGTSPRAINGINYYGFNRSYCGNTGGEPWYGRGSSFATDASYCARDWLSAPDRNGIKVIYRAKVVTGHYCAGRKGMRYLPERITGINFDSAVDNMTNPTEFNIFNDAQAYPEYCIEFTN